MIEGRGKKVECGKRAKAMRGGVVREKVRTRGEEKGRVEKTGVGRRKRSKGVEEDRGAKYVDLGKDSQWNMC